MKQSMLNILDDLKKNKLILNRRVFLNKLYMQFNIKNKRRKIIIIIGK